MGRSAFVARSSGNRVGEIKIGRSRIRLIYDGAGVLSGIEDPQGVLSPADMAQMLENPIITPKQTVTFKTIMLGNGEYTSPDPNKQWEIMSMTVSHITGTDTEITIYNSVIPSFPYFFAKTYPAATGSITEQVDLMSSRITLTPDCTIQVSSGAANAFLSVIVKEENLNSSMEAAPKYA